MTTCPYPDSEQSYLCITEEQCEDCYAIDHPEELMEERPKIVTEKIVVPEGEGFPQIEKEDGTPAAPTCFNVRGIRG
jgi:hypothetical protein